ncbi:hypothetical protein AB0D12_39040 [Streptomyces sp. NPDC048479]|uniref:hypothetical protein n=1 Tax=Streptomyces sp. NPDC048479 TaxID=3154725 RepID=UPI0034278B56
MRRSCQFTTKDGTRAEGVVASTAPAYDANNIGWLHVNDEHDGSRVTEFSHCVPVDPPIQPEDDSSRRPFDE